MPSDSKLGRSSCKGTAHVTGSTRRKFLGKVGVTGSVALLAGCSSNDGGDGGSDGGDGGGSDGGDGGGSDGGDGGGGSETLSIALQDGSGALVKELLETHVADETGIDMEITILPYANLFEKLVATLGNEDATYDIVSMDDPWFPRLAQHCDPVDQYFDIPDQLIQTTVDVSTWPAPKGPVVPSAQGMEEKVRAVPAVGNSQLFVVNERLYNEVDEPLPETWEDVLRAGQKISDQVDGSHGYVIRGQRGNPIMANFFGLGMSRAGDMFDEEWNYDWADDRGVDTCDFFVNKLKEISPDGVTSFDSEQVLNRLGDGRAAAAPQWPSGASTLLDPDKADEYDNLRFIPMPKGIRRAPQQGNWLLAINKYAPQSRREKAAEVLETFISKEAQNEYVGDIGGVPFRHDTFENHLDAEPWMEALYTSLQEAKWRPRTPLWSEISVTQGKQLNAGLTGQKDPQKAMNDAKEEIENVLDKAGYYE